MGQDWPQMAQEDSQLVQDIESIPKWPEDHPKIHQRRAKMVKDGLKRLRQKRETVQFWGLGLHEPPRASSKKSLKMWNHPPELLLLAFSRPLPLIKRSISKLIMFWIVLLPSWLELRASSSSSPSPGSGCFVSFCFGVLNWPALSFPHGRDRGYTRGLVL